MILKNIKSKKAMAPLFSGIMIILISIIFIGILIKFGITYFDNLEDMHKINKNKQTLSVINKTINDLKDNSKGSYKNLIIENKDDLIFDSKTNTIRIEQEVYSQSVYQKQKDLIRYGDLKIEKENNYFIYTLDLNGRIDINQSLVLTPRKNKIKLELTEDNKIVPKRVVQENWYDESFRNRIPIIIDSNKIEGDLEDFPVLIKLEDKDYLKEHANIDGSDILFTLGDGETKLYREIEDFNKASGDLYAWVKIPYLDSNSDTLIYMYFNNILGNESDSSYVWDEDYVGVWHMNNITDGNIIDSSINNNNGVNYGATQETKGIEFDGVDDYIKINHNSELDLPRNITISSWIYGNDFSSTSTIIGKGGNDNQETTYWIDIRDPNRIYFGGYDEDDNPAYISISTNKIEENKWLHIVATDDGQNIRIYINGEEVISDIKNQRVSGNWDISIGKRGDRNTHYFNGKINEIKIKNSALNEEWIKTEYNNQNNPEEFYNLGSIQTN